MRVIDGVLNYAGYTGDPGAVPFIGVNDSSRSAGFSPDPRSVRIEDVRPTAGRLSIDVEGVELLPHRTEIENFEDPVQVDAYLREVEGVIENYTGSQKVVASLQVAVRTSDRTAIAKGGVAPGSLVHSDYNLASLRDFWLPEVGIDLDSPEYKKYDHFRVYQTWRVLSPPPVRNNLAFCDVRSMNEEDAVRVQYVVSKPDPETSEMRDQFAENYLFKFRPEHRWIYFSELTIDELVVWMGFDGRSQETRVAHCAFRDRTVSDEAPPRVSIETRAFAFF